MCIFVVLLAGCVAPTPAPLSPLPSPTPITAPAYLTAPLVEAAPHLLLAERQAAAARDLPLLSLLWAPDARIVDTHGTDDPADDAIWNGLPAILDRYTIAVFPSPPPLLTAADLAVLSVEPESDRAHLTLGRDRWLLVQAAGRWWLQELQY
jgi:hypothetical protein